MLDGSNIPQDIDRRMDVKCGFRCEPGLRQGLTRNARHGRSGLGRFFQRGGLERRCRGARSEFVRTNQTETAPRGTARLAKSGNEWRGRPRRGATAGGPAATAKGSQRLPAQPQLSGAAAWSSARTRLLHCEVAVARCDRPRPREPRGYDRPRLFRVGDGAR